MFVHFLHLSLNKCQSCFLCGQPAHPLSITCMCLVISLSHCLSTDDHINTHNYRITNINGGMGPCHHWSIRIAILHHQPMNPMLLATTRNPPIFLFHDLFPLWCRFAMLAFGSSVPSSREPWQQSGGVLVPLPLPVHPPWFVRTLSQLFITRCLPSLISPHEMWVTCKELRWIHQVWRKLRIIDLQMYNKYPGAQCTHRRISSWQSGSIWLSVCFVRAAQVSREAASDGHT